jgi:hypothetical protein
LEKFLDRVNHDKLMGTIAKRVEEKRLLKLIREFLNAGVMENGLVSPSVEGTPQCGPLSPLLSNLVLDELDRELVKLERRGHRFVRYADDSNIYVRSERAGQRVKESVKRFITSNADPETPDTSPSRKPSHCAPPPSHDKPDPRQPADPPPATHPAAAPASQVAGRRSPRDKLKLKVNESKSAVAKPQKRKFPGDGYPLDSGDRNR